MLFMKIVMEIFWILQNFGLNDIETKTLRFIGNPENRILEDPLRIFRYVRFLSEKDIIKATVSFENGVPVMKLI